jgi:hypothetical protein
MNEEQVFLTIAVAIGVGSVVLTATLTVKGWMRLSWWFIALAFAGGAVFLVLAERENGMQGLMWAVIAFCVFAPAVAGGLVGMLIGWLTAKRRAG